MCSSYINYGAINIHKWQFLLTSAVEISKSFHEALYDQEIIRLSGFSNSQLTQLKWSYTIFKHSVSILYIASDLDHTFPSEVGISIQQWGWQWGSYTAATDWVFSWADGTDNLFCPFLHYQPPASSQQQGTHPYISQASIGVKAFTLTWHRKQKLKKISWPYMNFFRSVCFSWWQDNECHICDGLSLVSRFFSRHIRLRSWMSGSVKLADTVVSGPLSHHRLQSPFHNN